ncbi:MAG TPA: phosphate acetyltransferase [Solirubrobacteraceae bacterium]|nr:phosphate acetyltransferase [Solirubrobacteraceae bacterium]
MARTLLVVPCAAGVGVARTSIAVLRALDRRGIRTGYVKPVAQPRPDGGPDRSKALVTAVTALNPPDPLSSEAVEHQLGEGGIDAVLEEIVAIWRPVQDGADVVVVEGLSPWPTKVYISELNEALGAALDADVLLVGRWPANERRDDRGGLGVEKAADGLVADVEWLADLLALTATGYRDDEDARAIGCVVHGLPPAHPEAATQLREALSKRGLRAIGAAVHRPELTRPRVLDLVHELKPRIINEGDLSRRIKSVAVFAQAVPGGLHVLVDGALVVVPGDRHDVIMAACLAAANGTRLAALVLSAGVEPDPRVWALANATSATDLPLLLVPDNSYETATRVDHLDPGLPVDDPARLRAVTDAIADALDPAWLESMSSSSRPRRLSPAAFRYQLRDLAHAADACIVLPEGTEPRTLQAAVTCAERGIARTVLLGPPDDVMNAARSLGLELPSEIAVIDPEAVAERYVAPLVELRRHRGWSEQIARDRLTDAIWVGTMMLQQGEVDGLVAGAVHSTAATVRPALQILGTRPGTRLVSSVFFMCLPDEVVVYGDCAINPQPNAEDLADIAIQSAESTRSFGIEPRVAMISFSTGTSGAGSDVEKVAEATRIVRERAPDLAVDGPLQYDAAAIDSVAKAKRPDSPVAGHANVFIFPDLDAGNTTYKAVQRSAHVVSVGPMLQGLAKPVNDLSRGALVEDIVYTVALTAIQARSNRQP